MRRTDLWQGYSAPSKIDDGDQSSTWQSLSSAQDGVTVALLIKEAMIRHLEKEHSVSPAWILDAIGEPTRAEAMAQKSHADTD